MSSGGERSWLTKATLATLVAGLALAACSSTPQTQPAETVQTTTTITKVILKIDNNCPAALSYVTSHPPMTLAGSDSVIAASCTPGQLRAAIAAKSPSLNSQLGSAQESTMQRALCATSQYLRHCQSGS
jgi:hypothetical protein